MKAVLAICGIGALVALIIPFRRLRRPRAAVPAKLDAAAYAVMAAEAERIAAPFKRHVGAQLLALGPLPEEEFGGDFPEVDALLERAGIFV